jgi:hypothetical protein
MTNPPDNLATRPRESAFVMALLAAFLGLNLLTALSYPHVWMDEVMWADPAANLIQGRGFVSTAWPFQTSDRFFAGNVPLHPLVLAGWLKLFGLSPLAVRSFNYVWFTLGSFLVWRFCVRLRWIESTAWRLVLMALLAMGSGLSFSYRSGRYDMIGYFLLALSLNAATIPRPALRNLCLLGLGMLLPWAGLQLLPALAFIAVLIFAFWGFRPALNAVVLGAGALVGLAGLYWLYASHGVWHEFLDSIGKSTDAPAAQSRLAEWAGLFVRDRSAPFLLLLNAWLAAAAWKTRDAALARIASFGLAAGILLPPAMQAAGHFPIYYGWMTALPQSLAICHVLGRRAVKSFFGRVLALTLLAGAMVVGLPLRLLIAAAGSCPYSAVQQFAGAHLRPADIVLADYPAYYPAMRAARKVFTPLYLEKIMPAAERRQVNILVINPAAFASCRTNFPGDWRLAAEFTNQNVAPPILPAFLIRRFQSHQLTGIYAPYRLAVYRKFPVSSPPQAAPPGVAK